MGCDHRAGSANSVATLRLKRMRRHRRAGDFSYGCLRDIDARVGDEWHHLHKGDGLAFVLDHVVVIVSQPDQRR